MTDPNSLPIIRYRDLAVTGIHRQYDGVLEAEVTVHTAIGGKTKFWLTAVLDPNDPDCDHYPTRWELWDLTDEQWAEVARPVEDFTHWFEGGTPVAVVRL